MEKERLLTITQAANRLGINEKTLRRWSDAGKVPHIRTIGGQRRFEWSVVERLRHEMGFEDRETGEERDDAEALRHLPPLGRRLARRRPAG